jgi:hypothetical protein
MDSIQFSIFEAWQYVQANSPLAHFSEEPTFQEAQDGLLIISKEAKASKQETLYRHLFKDRPDLLWFEGSTYTRAACRAYLLFYFGPKVRIKVSKNFQLPKEAFLSVHHRHALKTFEVGAQFLLDFPKHSVITENHLKRYNIDFVCQHLFDQINIKDFSSDERYWTIAKAIRPRTAVSVFADREGSQYYGDQSMYFRPGLFAASIYSRVPIIDQVIIEPTEAVDETTISFRIWWPPHVEGLCCTTALEYAQWRKQHALVIENFMLACQADFLEHVATEEAIKASSSSLWGFCEPNETIERNTIRNRRNRKLNLK